MGDMILGAGIGFFLMFMIMAFTAVPRNAVNDMNKEHEQVLIDAGVGEYDSKTGVFFVKKCVATEEAKDARRSNPDG